MNENDKKLLILDLDETLISASGRISNYDFRISDENSSISYNVIKRPYVDLFLRQMNKIFDLAVWTSSSEDYARKIIAGLGYNKNNFAFIFSRNKCTCRINSDTGEYVFIKKLKKIKNFGYSLDKTLVVDDLAENHVLNYGNLVTIRPFTGGQDDELLHLIKYLTYLNQFDNVRPVEKRGWRNKF